MKTKPTLPLWIVLSAVLISAGLMYSPRTTLAYSEARRAAVRATTLDVGYSTLSPWALGCSNPYLVKRGDTLAALAARCGTTTANLRRWNSLAWNGVYAGQWLVTRGSSGSGSFIAQTGAKATKTRTRVTAQPTPSIEPPIAP